MSYDLSSVVSFDVVATEADLASMTTWPPRRFNARDARLAVFDQLLRGDFSQFQDVASRKFVVPINFLSRYSERLANLLLMSPPLAAADGVEVDAEEMDGAQDEQINLARTAYDAVIDLSAFGGCVLLMAGEELMAVDPTRWYPVDDGATWLVHPYASEESADGRPDRLEVTVVSPAETVERRVYRYHPMEVGELLEVEGLGPGSVVVVPRRPRRGRWGRAKYIDIAPPAVEIARRLSRNSQLLDRYSGPIPTFSESDYDAAVRYGVEDDDTDAERQRKILEGQLGIIEEDTVHLPDAVTGIGFLQPDVGGVGQSLDQVESLRTEIADLAGMPTLVGMAQPASGEALKRSHLTFYAESLALQTDLRLGLEELLGVPIRWPHIFDVLESGESQERERLAIAAAREMRLEEDDGDEEVEAE